MEEREEIHVDLAADVGVTRSYVTKWLNGDKSPGRAALTRVADHYGVSVDYLVGRTAVRQPSTGHEPLKEANERALLAAFHDLPAEEQALAVRLIRGLRPASPASRTPKRKRNHPAA